MTTIWGTGTPRTFRPLWVAEELELAYTHRGIESRTGETQTAEYQALNPKQKIPCLVDDRLTLTESVAISRYLIRRHGGADRTLSAPQTTEACAREDEWVAHVYGELDETALYVLRRHEDLKAIYGSAPAAVTTARAHVTRQLDLIAARVDSRRFLVDGGLSLADVMLMSCLDWAHFYDFELPQPLATYRAGLAERSAYQRAFARNYPQLISQQEA
ncbi:MAG: glutathione S-transferase family protein [Pseudomonadota bacterium]